MENGMTPEPAYPTRNPPLTLGMSSLMIPQMPVHRCCHCSISLLIAKAGSGRWASTQSMRPKKCSFVTAPSRYSCLPPNSKVSLSVHLSSSDQRGLTALFQSKWPSLQLYPHPHCLTAFFHPPRCPSCISFCYHFPRLHFWQLSSTKKHWKTSLVLL